MGESFIEFYETHRKKLQVIVIVLAIFLFYFDFLFGFAIVGGISVVWLVSQFVDEDNPLRNVLLVSIFGVWVLCCWQGFSVILKYESRKAETFCGKIVDSETRTAARQRSVYFYLIENQNSNRKTFTGYDYFGDKGGEICVEYVPAAKSVFFNRDYVLKIERK